MRKERITQKTKAHNSEGPRAKSARSHARSRARRTEPTGQIFVIMALCMVALLGLVGLSTDVGYMYFQHQALQNDVDSAVTSGASYLPDNSAQAVSTAKTYAKNNGVADSEITSTTVAPNDLSLSMTLTRSVSLFFSKVLGINTARIAVTATSGVPFSPNTIGGPNAPAGSRSGNGSSVGAA
jgi:Flp pilus assembly protein TadG